MIFSIKTFTLLTVVLVCVLGVTSIASAATFSRDQIYHNTYAGVPSFSMSGQAGNFLANSSTGNKVCQLLGAGSLTSYTTSHWSSCSDNYTISWNGSSWTTQNGCLNNSWIDTITCGQTASTSVNLSCDKNSDCGTSGYTGSKFCKGNDVYQKYTAYACNKGYDSWGSCNSAKCSSSTSDKLVKSCSSNQTCSNGACVDQNITCSTDAQCGTSGFVGDSFCQGNGVYKNYKQYTCNNPGTASSTCSNKTTATKYYDCSANQTCNGGFCIDQNIACSTDAQCGTNEYTGSPFCQGNSVYQNFKAYTCNNAGTSTAYCSSSTTAQKKNDCSTNQTCGNGSCTNQNITCSTNSDCGTSGLTGSPFCQGNSVYQNYKAYTCNNAGTATSYCSNSTEAQLQNSCSTNQTCGNGSCTNYNNLSVSCYASPSSVNYGQQVTFNSNVSGGNGNYAYSWYGICSGNASNCSTTVYNNSSQTQTLYVTSGNQSQSATCNVNTNQNQCNYHALQKCNGNALYWYDSCGNQQELSQVCTNGCSNNQCQYNTQGYLNVTKQVRNLTTGTGWSSSTYASPNDVVMFLITIQTSGNQSIQNVNVRDFLPSNLIYNDQLVVSGANNNYNNYNGSLISGIYLDSITAGQSATISYQTRVAPVQNFSFGTSTLNNSVTVTSSSGSQNASASVIVNRTQVLGASSVSTGLTNNIWLDSFILPLLVVLAGLGLYKSGAFVGLEKWITTKRKTFATYKNQNDLDKRIKAIQRNERQVI